MEHFKRNIKKHKLTLSFLLIIALFLSSGVITIKGLFTLGNLTRMIHEHPLVVSNASLTAALNIANMHRSMKDVVLATSSGERGVALAAALEKEQIVYQQLDIVKEKILGEEGQTLEAQIRRLFIAWQPIRNEVVRLLNSGRAQEAISITKAEGADHVANLQTKMLELTSYARKKANGFLEIAETSQTRLERITILMTLSGVIFSVIIAMIATYLVLTAETNLMDERNKLQAALDEIKTLRGIIPICSHCKQIRDDKGLWKQIEEYIHAHSEAEFSHSICPSCMREHYSQFYAPAGPEQ